MKRFWVIAAWCAASPAFADLKCELVDPQCTTSCEKTDVRFDVDPSQFVAAQDPNDPPRRQITNVTQGATTFTAQAIMMPGGVLGFHEDAGELGSRLMIVQADGAARLTLQPANQTLIGYCIED